MLVAEGQPHCFRATHRGSLIGHAVGEDLGGLGLPVAQHIGVEETRADDAIRNRVTSIEHWYGIPDAATRNGMVFVDLVKPGSAKTAALMAQVAGILMLKQAENAGKIAYFMSAENVKWRKPVRPGDTLIIDVEMTKNRGRIGKAKKKAQA